ncbi:Uncharacterized protein TCM_043033 [Theobroma cacao]|uniref:Uncharacterized protein n=1 Tax=Theobroma cacao TaxID=3641 RepID=A0A061FP51_THECC|nr:Uncharacterized protein TCM_043033 [Theobroma cacao]
MIEEKREVEMRYTKDIEFELLLGSIKVKGEGVWIMRLPMCVMWGEHMMALVVRDVGVHTMMMIYAMCAMWGEHMMTLVVRDVGVHRMMMIYAMCVMWGEHMMALVVRDVGVHTMTPTMCGVEYT